MFLAVDDCNKGIARTTVNVTNAGRGRLTFSVPTVTTALVTQASSGVVPASIEFVMEPGRSGVVRQPGTNLFTVAGSGGERRSTSRWLPHRRSITRTRSAFT